jgi:hypothetical protein
MGPLVYIYAAGDSMPRRPWFVPEKAQCQPYKSLVSQDEAESRQLCVMKRVLSMRSNVLLLARVTVKAARGCVLDACTVSY